MPLDIINNKIRTVSANVADGSFPISNVLTEYKSEVYKSTGASAVITVNATSSNQDGSGVGGVYIGGTNAYKMEVSLDGAGAVTTYRDDVTAITTDTTYTEDTTIAGDIIVEAGVTLTTAAGVTIENIEPYNVDKQLWYKHPRVVGNYTLTITLYTLDPILEIGIIRAGSIHSFRAPKHGLIEGEIDTSVRLVLLSGGMYTKERVRLRTLSGSIDVDPEDMYNIKSMLDKALFTGVAAKYYDTSVRGLIYGRLTQSSSVNLQSLNLHVLTFSVRENV